jgi:asparagine synthase (glutamine-hydrolysing)
MHSGLCATRLAILDLSAAGHQPMTTEDGRYTIAFNGEIYNYRELRSQLSADCYQFRSHSDTEVVLALYQRKGGTLVKELRGMFAFAVWDEQEKTCFLVRDPLGIKPLYYYFDESQGLLLFASELRPLLQSCLVPKQLSPAGLHGFFRTGSVPEPYTLVENVYCLEAGASLLWRDGKITKQQYWRPRFEPNVEITASQAVEQTRTALFDSVSHHFVSDVPVGIFLSGGIDSTAILALSRLTGQTDLQTFSISFEDPAFNEGDVAARTARHFETHHTDWRLSGETALQLFDTFLSRQDQPSIDGFNTFMVSKLVHDHGLKVVLSGLGGDELFGGYPSFRRVPKMVNVSRRMGILRPARQAAGRLLEFASAPQIRRLGSYLQSTPSAGSAYDCVRGVFTSREADRLLPMFGLNGANGRDDARGPRAGLLQRDRHSDGVSQSTLADEVSYLELTRYMRNQLLRDSDVMSMAWSLELRVPFVDRALVETISRIPAPVRLRTNKQLLLDAVPEVPEWVWNRPKRGFLFPFQKWLEQDWGRLFNTITATSPVPAQTWYQKWGLFVVQRWCESTGISLSRPKPV